MNKKILILGICLIFVFGCIQETSNGGVFNTTNDSSDQNTTLDNITIQNNCGEYEIGETWETYDGCNTCNCGCDLVYDDYATIICGCTEMYCPTEEDKMAEQFGCDNIYLSETIKEIIFYECLKLNYEGDYIYEIDYHPMGYAMVTYAYGTDGNYSLISTQEELTSLLAPIDSEITALKYVVLYYGLNWFGHETGVSYAEDEGDYYSVKVTYEDNIQCPCYGSLYESYYTVTESGEITEISTEEIESFSEPDCQC